MQYAVHSARKLIHQEPRKPNLGTTCTGRSSVHAGTITSIASIIVGVTVNRMVCTFVAREQQQGPSRHSIPTVRSAETTRRPDSTDDSSRLCMPPEEMGVLSRGRVHLSQPATRAHRTTLTRYITSRRSTYCTRKLTGPKYQSTGTKVPYRTASR